MDKPLTKNVEPDRPPLALDEYVRAGGYEGLRAAMGMEPRALIQAVTDSGLAGRGGAGFPTGKKWSAVPAGDKARHPTYVCVNGDEMEPGTFKDRLLLEGDPHQMIEGALTAAWAVQAGAVYIFVRQEYHLAIQRLTHAIGEACAARYAGPNIMGGKWSCDVRLHSSAGRYMCGEETGMINALQGRRANPRTKPPYSAVCGLWGTPTVVNNVETLCNAHHIALHGAEWFKKLSLTDEGGTKLYGVSGRVNRPGCWELPMGTTIRELLEEHAGGMKDGFRLRGLLPGGASTSFLTEQHLDVRMDFKSMEKAGGRMGTGTMIILDDKTCPVAMVHNLMTFFARESCGWCTPCREGLPWLEKTLRAIELGEGKPEDLDILDQMCTLITGKNTFCALAPGAIEPLQSSLKWFRDDYKRHIDGHGCPFKAKT